MKQLISVLVIGLAVLGCKQKAEVQSSSNESPESIRVAIKIVESQETDGVLYFSGQIEPILTVPLSFKLPAAIANIYVSEGDRVNKGDVLAELDKTMYQSTYNAALAMEKQAEDAYGRLKTVYDNGSLPEIKWEEIKSKLEQANSTAQIAQQNVDNCRILAPISGIVGARNIEVGSNATPGITAFKLISIDEIYARVSVPENEINNIKKGQIAQITLPAIKGKVFEGTVEKVGVVANTISKTYEVKLRINNKNREIKPGMVCNIGLPLNTGPAGILVPVQSVMTDANAVNYVFVVDKENQRVSRRNILTSKFVGNQLFITSGLKPGEWIVVNGVQKLSNNSKVSFN